MYKGAIFGSLMVYVWPALMHAALSMQAAEAKAIHPAPSGDDAAASANVAQAVSPSQSNSIVAPASSAAAVPLIGSVASLDGEQPTMPVGRVVLRMLTRRRHALCALLLLWGVSTGGLGVAVTVSKQIRAARG